MLNKELFVKIPPNKSYPVFIDFEPIENLENKVFACTNANKILIVINEKVNKLYGKKLNIKNSIKFVLKDGEHRKNFKNYKRILDFALKNKLERKDAIVAIGGGVVGDIAGFVAATYLRGIDFIQIPTTLLACVDSSVGGKVAINTDYGKNLVGAFYQPKAVFCNLNFLKTLDKRHFKTGLAEVVKYAFIEAAATSLLAGEVWGEGYLNFFDFLMNNSDKILARNEEILAEIIEISLKIKASIVEKDEKEQGLRKILNFGHTYGHAVEKITNYKKYTHGEAVAIGMVFAINLAFKKGLISEEYKNEGLELIKKYNLVKKMPEFNEKRMIELMKADKKVKDGKINFILPSSKSFVDCFEFEL
ncbi:MAG: 3-dehydroquinate synthase [Candidatus Gastranaerophilales bacterium]|nr:3-dehydroquinate synthase [Candidatus Gastranaerophilales bacterium]